MSPARLFCIRALAGAMAVTALVYAAGAFIQMDGNPAFWPVEMRTGLVVVDAFVGGFFGLCCGLSAVDR